MLVYSRSSGVVFDHGACDLVGCSSARPFGRRVGSLRRLAAGCTGLPPGFRFFPRGVGSSRRHLLMAPTGVFSLSRPT